SHGYEYPPGDATIIPPTGGGGGTGGNNGPSAEIVSPQDGSTITSLPVTVSVLTDQSDPMSHVDLLVDGSQIASSSNAPFVFSINQNFSDGPHVISVHAVDKQGKSADTSVNVNFAVNQVLNITTPGFNQTLSFPQTITAESAQAFGS